jgi:hypothetical protein
MAAEQARASRSFIPAGSNAHGKKLKLRIKFGSRSYRGRGYASGELMVMDQSGAMVPPVNFDQYLREQFREACADLQSIQDHADDVDSDDDEAEEELREDFRSCMQGLDLPVPFERLFSKMSYDAANGILEAQRYRNRWREVSQARMVCEQRVSADALNVILGFLGGKFGVRAPFMLRRDISGAMIDLLYEYNAYQNSNIDEEDPYDIAADATFEHGYHSGRFSALRWVVHWEGETDSDSEFSDEEDDGEDEDWF